MKEIISTKFWKEYAPLYQKFTPKFQKKQLEFIANFAQGKVADLGIGVGKLIPYLNKNKNVTKIIGIDNNEEMLKYALKRDSNKSLKIIKSELTKIDYKIINNLDSLILTNVLYANSNPIKLLKNISEKTNDNNRIIISDMSRDVKSKELLEYMLEEFKEDKDLEKYIKMNFILVQDSKPRTYFIEEICSVLELLDYKIYITSKEHFLNSNYTIIANKN